MGDSESTPLGIGLDSWPGTTKLVPSGIRIIGANMIPLVLKVWDVPDIGHYLNHQYNIPDTFISSSPNHFTEEQTEAKKPTVHHQVLRYELVLSGSETMQVSNGIVPFPRWQSWAFLGSFSNRKLNSDLQAPKICDLVPHRPIPLFLFLLFVFDNPSHPRNTMLPAPIPSLPLGAMGREELYLWQVSFSGKYRIEQSEVREMMKESGWPGKTRWGKKWGGRV